MLFVVVSLPLPLHLDVVLIVFTSHWSKPDLHSWVFESRAGFLCTCSHRSSASFATFRSSFGLVCAKLLHFDWGSSETRATSKKAAAAPDSAVSSVSSGVPQVWTSALCGIFPVNYCCDSTPMICLFSVNHALQGANFLVVLIYLVRHHIQLWSRNKSNRTSSRD